MKEYLESSLINIKFITYLAVMSMKSVMFVLPVIRTSTNTRADHSKHIKLHEAPVELLIQTFP
jgi:chromosome condensin MukBEF ATPase and DNA-binding subunit MukB